MALQIIGTNSIGTGVRVPLTTTDDAFIAPGVTIGSTDGRAIHGTGSAHFVSVQGTVTAYGQAIELGDSLADSAQDVLIGDGAYVSTTESGKAAITVRGSFSEVYNRGTVFGVTHAIAVGGSGAGGPSRIVNTGHVEASDMAVSRLGTGPETIVLDNRGGIRATIYAYLSLGEGQDNVINSGLMVGKIDLAAGDDFYNGATGRLTGAALGGDGNDELRGGIDSDVFIGNSGNDILYGNGGDDSLDGEADADQMFGGLGNDSYGVDNAGDIASEAGGNGVDTVRSSISFSLADAVHAIAAIENLVLLNAAANGSGNALVNTITGNTIANILDGAAGNDVLYGLAGTDTLVGGVGNDVLDGGTEADHMVGGIGNDVYRVDNAGDVVDELTGNGIDTVLSSLNFNLADAVHAKGAVERLTLTGTAVYGLGNALANVLAGNGGGNTLAGRAGDDAISGGRGNDRLFGGLGNDALTGGADSDIFVFDTPLNALTNRDAIADFSHVDDTIQLENAIFAKLGAAGALNPGFFFAGAAAHDANDYIVYNQSTGALIYDANGNAAGGATQFATIANHAALAANDFVVI